MDDSFLKDGFSQCSHFNENCAMSIIQPLLQSGSFLPFTSASIKPFNLVCILNEIIINKRNKILEFGSGISTILMGRLIKNSGIDCKIISVEHDKSWIDFIKKYIDVEQIDGIVNIIHSPLTSCKEALEDNQWYDKKILCANGLNEGKFDMIIIDGPPAWEQSKQKARYPAFPFVFPKLCSRAIVYLDDVDREGEKLIIKKWEEDYQIKFSFVRTLGYYIHGKAFNSILA